MTHAAIRMAENLEQGGYALAGVVHGAMCDAALAAAERRAALGDATAARALAIELRRARTRAARLERELAEFRARALRAEGILVRQAEARPLRRA